MLRGMLPISRHRKTRDYKLPSMPETLIRPSLPTDVAAIAEIHARNVFHGTGT
ncbi:hypothetical protein SAMN05421778_101118 [Sphaerotilus natans]|nr:hypothetical protein SAMN05421778_101118 [Sphaerotilus natans]